MVELEATRSTCRGPAAESAALLEHDDVQSPVRQGARSGKACNAGAQGVAAEDAEESATPVPVEVAYPARTDVFATYSTTTTIAISTVRQILTDSLVAGLTFSFSN